MASRIINLLTYLLLPNANALLAQRTRASPRSDSIKKSRYMPLRDSERSTWLRGVPPPFHPHPLPTHAPQSRMFPLLPPPSPPHPRPAGPLRERGITILPSTLSVDIPQRHARVPPLPPDALLPLRPRSHTHYAQPSLDGLLSARTKPPTSTPPPSAGACPPFCRCSGN